MLIDLFCVPVNSTPYTHANITGWTWIIDVAAATSLVTSARRGAEVGRALMLPAADDDDGKM